MKTTLLTFILMLLFCSPSFAEWSFTDAQAQDLCVLMEKYDNCNSQIQTCIEANNELEQENTLLKQNYKLAINNYEIEKGTNKLLKERIVLMDKQCDKRVEEAKPKFKDKFTWFGTGYGAGVLTVIIIGIFLL